MTVRQVKRSHTLHTACSYLRQRERDCIALGARAEVPPVPPLARMRARGPLRVRACVCIVVRHSQGRKAALFFDNLMCVCMGGRVCVRVCSLRASLPKMQAPMRENLVQIAKNP